MSIGEKRLRRLRTTRLHKVFRRKFQEYDIEEMMLVSYIISKRDGGLAEKVFLCVAYAEELEHSGQTGIRFLKCSERSSQIEDSYLGDLINSKRG